MFFETVLSCDSPVYYKISKYRQRGKSHPQNLIMEKCVLNVFETVNYGVNCREAVERYDMEVNRIHAPDRSSDKRRQKVEMFFNFVDEVEIPRAGRTNDCRIYPWTQKKGVTSTVTPFSALTAGQIVSYDC